MAKDPKSRQRDLLSRHRDLLLVEEALWLHGVVVAGIDEVGTGPLAGPVVAACVVLDPGSCGDLVGVDDSKKLTEVQREVLAEKIRTRSIAFSVGRASVDEIDRLNIRQAALLAMERAYAKVASEIVVNHLLVDARRLPGVDLPQSEIIGGDRLCLSIAAASIIAKVERDREMEGLATVFPGYGLEKHKGYGTRAHLDALRALGPSEIHRKSFAPVRAVSCETSDPG